MGETGILHNDAMRNKAPQQQARPLNQVDRNRRGVKQVCPQVDKNTGKFFGNRAMTQNPDKKARLNRNDETDFLRDFDLLTAISKEELSLYSVANIEVGESLMASTYVLKGDNTQYKIRDHINQFMPFGPGIYLLFKFMKNLTLVFGGVSILAIVSILVLNIGRLPRESVITNQLKLAILKTTIYNLTSQDFSLFVACNFVITLILSAFLIYWTEQEKKYVIECLENGPLASYSTVIFKNLPENYSERWLQTLIESNIGQVAEIYTVRNFGDDILDYKQMTEIVQEYKEQKTMIQLTPKRNSHNLSNLFFYFRSYHIKMKQQIKQSQNYKPGFAFVQFKRIQDRQRLLEICNNFNLFSCCCNQHPDPTHQNLQNNTDHGFKFQLSKMEIVQCDMEPGGILWENLHLTKTSQVIKISVMILLVAFVLSVSIFLIFLLSAVQMSVMNSKFINQKRENIVKIKGDSFALLSYCINLSFSQFYQQSDICSPYNSEYIKLTAMLFMIPLSISLFKLVLTEIMKSLVSFRRYAYEIKKIQSQSTIIFVFYFLVTGVLQLLIYIGSDEKSIFEVFTPLIQQIVHKDFRPQKITLFSDFSPDWYITASYNIIIIGAISFNLSGIGIIFYCKIRKRLFKYFALRQKIQIQMNSWLKGYVLQIQYVYAALLTIVYFTLLFGSAMPLLYILAFFSFLILFFSYKYIFITFCAKPLTYNHSINKRVRKMLFGALIMQCFTTPIFYTAPNIAQFSGYDVFFARLGALWYYYLLMVLLFLYVCFEKSGRIMLTTFIRYVKSQRQERKKTVSQDQPLPNHGDVHRKNFTLPTMVRKKHNQLHLASYSMHESEAYKQILRTLYTINNRERARKTCALNKELMHLYEGNAKASDNDELGYRTLVEVIKVVRRDFKKYKQRHGKSRNPYGKTKRKLYEIFEHSKKGKNHKYTLCMNGSNGFSSLFSSDGFSSATGDNIIEGDRDDLKFEMNSNCKTKDSFLGPLNLQQVIEAASCLQDDQESRRMDEKSRKKISISRFQPRQSSKLQTPEEKEPSDMGNSDKNLHKTNI